MRPVCVLLLRRDCARCAQRRGSRGGYLRRWRTGRTGLLLFPALETRSPAGPRRRRRPADVIAGSGVATDRSRQATDCSCHPTASRIGTRHHGRPATTCSGACARNRWSNFLESIRSLTPRRQLDAVNRWANAKPYVEDWTNWGVPDYWETPAEFVARGGDCEDYAIAKYFSLVRLGFSPAALRIVVVNDRNLQAFHAVLAVRQSGQTWLLDNAVPAVVPMSVAIQYAPVYALNERSWWLYSAPRIIVSSAYVAENGPATSAPAPERRRARARTLRPARQDTAAAPQSPDCDRSAQAQHDHHDRAAAERRQIHPDLNAEPRQLK